jgi:hypothetical protein
MKTDYEKQAQDFLNEFGIKFRATLADSKPSPWRGERDTTEPHHYRVTLSKAKPIYRLYEEIAEQPKFVHRLTFDFWSSIADAEKGIKTVTAYSVLASISGDVNCPETFKDFCVEYGYGSDSINALQTFRRCASFGKRLRAFFTQSEIEKLQEIQ